MGERLSFDQPWVDLLALPLALLVSLLFGATPFGGLLLAPFQIQFHELGHALLAWLSSRAALPLPFGFTFWSEQPSLFSGCCMAFLLGLFVLHARREQRTFAAMIGILLSLAFVWLSLFTSVDHSRMLILLGGLAGELVITSLLMVAFYIPLPDRVRWDFFRFVLLGPASASWLAALQLWFGVWRGTRRLPTGSILGTTGDGSGDLDRLIAEYDFNPRSLSSFYSELALWTLGVLLVVYAFFALRAARRIWPRPSFARPSSARKRARVNNPASS